MGKLLFLLLAIALIFWVRKLIRSNERRRNAQAPHREAERMVNCLQCGLYLPLSEAVEERGHYYCSEQHRRLGSR